MFFKIKCILLVTLTSAADEGEREMVAWAGLSPYTKGSAGQSGGEDGRKPNAALISFPDLVVGLCWLFLS